jgi:hypothetical protein
MTDEAVSPLPAHDRRHDDPHPEDDDHRTRRSTANNHKCRNGVDEQLETVWALAGRDSLCPQRVGSTDAIQRSSKGSRQSCRACHFCHA